MINGEGKYSELFVEHKIKNLSRGCFLILKLKNMYECLTIKDFQKQWKKIQNQYNFLKHCHHPVCVST